MKAIQFAEVGGVLSEAKVNKPTPQKGFVLIKQRYSSVNPADHKIQMNNPFKFPLPCILGFDVSGTVVELGEGITRFKVGDEVFGSASTLSAFAEYVVAPEILLAKRVTQPAAVAAASNSVFATGWLGMYGGLGEDLSTFDINTNKYHGKTIFIPGGGGGIGHVLVQFAKKSGFKVITSASKPESIKLSHDCKADHVLDYSKCDVVQEVLKLTNNEGVDFVVDTTYSPSSFASSALTMKKGGLWICIGISWADQHKEALKNCEARGATAKTGDFGRYLFVPEYTVLADKHIGHCLAECEKLYASGDVRVKITKVIPLELEPVKEEVLAVGETKRFGKVVVEIAGDK